MIKKSVLTALLLILSTGPAFAHGGRTNAQGCHNDRANGTYHCHGGRSEPAVKRTASVSQSLVPSTRTSERLAPSVEPTFNSNSVVLNAPLDPDAQVGAAHFYFKNCDEARALNKAPMKTVAQGYREVLDSNNDGVACGVGDE